MDNGILIAIDGIDGAGKTTQVKRLVDNLRSVGELVVAAKEPTDGTYGRMLRASASIGRMEPGEELQAFLNDRSDNVNSVIAPALKSGHIVILDRYHYSTIAYQGARGASRQGLIEMLGREFPRPDIAIFLEVPAEIGVARVAESRGDTPNQFEGLDNLRNVRQIFQELADSPHLPEIVVVNGSGSIEQVQQQIAKAVVEGPLRKKRCSKNYECDILYCSHAITDTCPWFAIRRTLLGGQAAQASA